MIACPTLWPSFSGSTSKVSVIRVRSLEFLFRRSLKQSASCAPRIEVMLRGNCERPDGSTNMPSFTATG